MKNIERFNLYAAYLFGKLYQEFPVHRPIDPVEVVRSVNLPPPEKLAEGHDAMATEANLVVHTVMWLVETGYLVERLRKKGKRYVLAPKAFEAMKAPLLASLQQGEEGTKTKSVGEKLVEVSREFSRELAKESRRQGASKLVEVSSQLVGQVIGHAMKTFSGP